MTLSPVLLLGEDDSKQRVSLFSHKIEREKLKPGDHIYAYRATGVYQHHGIYIGKWDIEVIHFTGRETKSKSTAHIRVASLDTFLCDGELHLVLYDTDWAIEKLKIAGTSHTMVSRPASTVIATAISFAQNPHSWGDYHLLTNNCEHFATYCKTGVRVVFESQVGGWRKNLLFYVTPYL